jgi:hypothetical protein
VDDEYDTIMGKILVPEGPDKIPDGTVLCETWHPPTDDDEDNNDKRNDS